MFKGFMPESVEFLWNIRFNNTPDWYSDHREECHVYLDVPMRELAGKLWNTMDMEYPELHLMTKVCRIYRDRRRLHGQPPYRDHLWLTIRSSDTAEAQPGFYFEIAPEGYSYGTGFWRARLSLMDCLRRRIDADPEPVERLVLQLQERPEFRLETLQYKKPKGDPGPLLSPLYNSRNVDILAEYSCGDLLYEPGLYDQVLEGFRFLVPWYRFFLELEAEDRRSSAARKK